MPEADYDALLAAARAVSNDPVRLRALFDERLPHYRIPAKFKIGRHPDTRIAFLVCESLKLKNATMKNALVVDPGNQRDFLTTATRIISATQFFNNTVATKTYMANATPRISPERSRALSVQIIDEKAYDALLLAVKNANHDPKTINALFVRHLPRFKCPRKKWGAHPHTSIAFLILDSLEFTSGDEAKILSLAATTTPSSLRSLLSQSGTLLTIEDYEADRRKPYAVRFDARRPRGADESTGGTASKKTVPADLMPADAIVNTLKGASLSMVYGVFSAKFPKWRGGTDSQDNMRAFFALHVAGLSIADISYVMGELAGSPEERLRASGFAPNETTNRFALKA